MEQPINNLSTAHQIVYDARDFICNPLCNIANYNCKADILIDAGGLKHYLLHADIKFISEDHNNDELTFLNPIETTIQLIDNYLKAIIPTKQTSGESKFLVDFIINHTCMHVIYKIILTMKKFPIKYTKLFKIDSLFPMEKYKEKIKNGIKLSGEKGLTHSQIIRMSQSLGKESRKNIMQEIIFEKLIISETIQGKSKFTKIYKWNPDHE